MRGKLITFEGGEGSGKTTQISMFSKYIRSLGIQCVVTREPGGVRIAERIREVILNSDTTNMDYLTELLLFLASRRQVVKELIEPTLNAGMWVLCDRYTDSSVVYQGFCRGLGVDLVHDLNNLVVGENKPDITFYLDVNPAIGLGRVRDRGDSNRLDDEDIKFHVKVREGYKSLVLWETDRMCEIDASTYEDMVFESIKRIIESKNWI